MNLKLILMLLVLGLSVTAQNINHKVMTLHEPCGLNICFKFKINT